MAAQEHFKPTQGHLGLKQGSFTPIKGPFRLAKGPNRLTRGISGKHQALPVRRWPLWAEERPYSTRKILLLASEGPSQATTGTYQANTRTS